MLFSQPSPSEFVTTCASGGRRSIQLSYGRKKQALLLLRYKAPPSPGNAPAANCAASPAQNHRFRALGSINIRRLIIRRFFEDMALVREREYVLTRCIPCRSPFQSRARAERIQIAGRHVYSLAIFWRAGGRIRRISLNDRQNSPQGAQAAAHAGSRGLVWAGERSLESAIAIRRACYNSKPK